VKRGIGEGVKGRERIQERGGRRQETEDREWNGGIAEFWSDGDWRRGYIVKARR
jgi:hypothetical protein